MASNSSSDDTTVIKGAYWLSSKADKFPIDSVNTKYFTHLFYNTVKIDPETHRLFLSDNDKKLIPKFISTLHGKNPPVKCILSIGLPNHSPNAFSEMASSKAYRNDFITSTIDVATDYNFDGLDLYWKYPNSRNDMTNLGLLFQEWHAATKSNLSLSAVVYFTHKIDAERAYPETLVDNVNFVNLVSYDYYESDTPQTAEHALLNNFEEPSKSTSSGIKSWLDAEVPASKLVMGLPLYGRTWTLAEASKHGIGAPATGNGVMEYNDIVLFNDKGGNPTEDSRTASAYSYAGTKWVGYDSSASIETKVEYAKNNGLAGYFLWAIGMDHKDQLSREAFNAWHKGTDSSGI